MSLILDGTNGLSDVDGTAAAPAIRGTDANTGIFFPAADTIAFSEGGVEAMRIDSSGNVGIGTASPGQKLEVAGNALLSNNQYLGIKDSAGAAVGFPIYTGSNDAIFGYLASGSTGISTYQFRTGNNTERMRIDSSGRVGIGTTSPTGILNVKGTGGDALPATSGSTQSAGLITRLQQGGAIGSVMDIGGNGGTGSWIQVTEASNLATNYNLLLNPNGGNLLVGTTSVSGGRVNVLAAGGATGIVVQVTTNGNYGLAFNNASGTNVGRIQIDSAATSFVTSSDYRLKENIAPMTGALAKVAALKPVTYRWKSDGSDAEGFIAHELAEVCPQSVSGSKDAVDADGNPVYQGIDTSFLVATLTAAIQEQQALITALTTRITALEAA